MKLTNSSNSMTPFPLRSNLLSKAVRKRRSTLICRRTKRPPLWAQKKHGWEGLRDGWPQPQRRSFDRRHWRNLWRFLKLRLHWRQKNKKWNPLGVPQWIWWHARQQRWYYLKTRMGWLLYRPFYVSSLRRVLREDDGISLVDMRGRNCDGEPGVN